MGTEKNMLKQKVTSVRIRTWTLSIDIVVALVLYFLVNVSFKQRIDFVEFAFVTGLQLLAYAIYFPDGDLFGQRSTAFINNKTAYNQKASEINNKGRISELRRYCDYDYKERKHSYLINELGSIGFTIDEFNSLKPLLKKEIKSMKRFEFDGKKKAISRTQKKVLIKLLFKKSPVKPNTAETVMNANENNFAGKIIDTSKIYNIFSFSKKIFRAVVIGAFLAYLAYTGKDGIHMQDIVKIVIYFTAVFASAVTAYSAGETSSKIHKSNFYLSLCNFIDSFNEWLAREKKQ